MKVRDCVITSYSIHYTKLYELEEAGNGLTDRFRGLLSGLWDDLTTLDRRVTELDHEISMIAQSDPVAKRLQQLRGVGPMVATALVATVGNAGQVANGRQMAASLGLTPKQHSSGGKDRLLSISKRGDARITSYNVCYTKLLRNLGLSSGANISNR